MQTDKTVQAAKDVLGLVLGFFQRVESKSSVLLAIDTGMLGFLATNAPPLRELTTWIVVFGGVTLGLLAGSLVFLYRGAFPQLSGGHNSLIYFREIALRTEHKFIEEFKAQTEDQFANDLLGQAWRNAEILTAKFDCLKHAFSLTALAIGPWLVAIVLCVAANAHAHMNLLK